MHGAPLGPPPARQANSAFRRPPRIAHRAFAAAQAEPAPDAGSTPPFDHSFAPLKLPFTFWQDLLLLLLLGGGLGAFGYGCVLWGWGAAGASGPGQPRGGWRTGAGGRVGLAAVVGSCMHACACTQQRAPKPCPCPKIWPHSLMPPSPLSPLCLPAARYLKAVTEVSELLLQADGNPGFPADPAASQFGAGRAWWVGAGAGVGLAVGLSKAALRLDTAPTFIHELQEMHVDPIEGLKVGAQKGLSDEGEGSAVRLEGTTQQAAVERWEEGRAA